MAKDIMKNRTKSIYEQLYTGVLLTKGIGTHQ